MTGASTRATALQNENLDRILKRIVDTACRLHRGLGPGLLKSVYQAVLARQLRQQGLRVAANRAVAFEFDDMTFATGLRVDLLVNDVVVVEIRSVEALAPVHWKQTLTYLRLLDLPVGLLLNFGGATMKQGIRRIVNGYRPRTRPPLPVPPPASAAARSRGPWPET